MALQTTDRNGEDAMAASSDLRSDIKSNHKVAEEGLDSPKPIFDVDGSRTQAVRITRVGDSGWAAISTAVCREGEVSARAALVRNARTIVGGLALHGPGFEISGTRSRRRTSTPRSSRSRCCSRSATATSSSVSCPGAATCGERVAPVSPRRRRRSWDSATR